MNDDIEPPDGPLTSEEEAIVANLSADIIKLIDDSLLSYANTSWRKVAFLVGSTMMKPEFREFELPDIYYSQRIRKLVEDGFLESEGNLDYMRYSEVRLPINV